MDIDVVVGQSYAYKLTAVDIHENESLFSEEVVTGPVPVELTIFTAFVEKLNVMLQWETATETDNFGFGIERRGLSDKETKWEEINFVGGHGTTSQPRRYQFVDRLNNKHLQNANYQYRLKQIDLDGSFVYSQVLTVALDIPEAFELSQNFPNPFNPETVIRYQLPASASIRQHRDRYLQQSRPEDPDFC